MNLFPLVFCSSLLYLFITCLLNTFAALSRGEIKATRQPSWLSRSVLFAPSLVGLLNVMGLESSGLAGLRLQMNAGFPTGIRCYFDPHFN